VRHEIAAVGGVIDVQYQFDIGASGVPVSAIINGHFARNPAGGITMDLYAWNYTGTPAFELIHANIIPAANTTTDGDYTANLLARNTEGGKAILRFYKTGVGTASLNIDQLIVSYAESTSASIALILDDTGTSGVALLTATQASIDAIEADTDELQTNQGAWATATGFATPTNITAASGITLADGAITAAKIANAAIDAATFAADVDAEARGWLGMAAADLDTQLAALPTAAEIFAATLTTQLTEAYAANATAPTLAQAIFLIQQSLHEFSISDVTRTVYKLDGAATAATFTLDDADAPTSTTRAT